MDLFTNLGYADDQKVHRELKIFLGFLILAKDEDDEDVERERNIYDRFCEILKETKSVIHGNFILNAVSPINKRDGTAYVTSELDIVATYSGAVAINDFIKTEMNHIFLGSEQNIIIFQPYKHSIERQNKMQSQIMYNKRSGGFSLFINIVDDDPSRVVSRQYVSFLQILFDGEHVKAIHIEDVKNKKGTLKEEYLPLIEPNHHDYDDSVGDEDYSVYFTSLNIQENIDEYRSLGFEINYDKKSQFIGHEYLYGTDVSREEHFVLYLYHNLVNKLVNDVFTNMLNTGFYNEDITCADIYLRWFYLEKPTIKEFMKIIKKIVKKGIFLLPLWIKATCKTEDDIENALLINSCSLYTYFSEYRYERKKDPRRAEYFAYLVIQNDIKPKRNLRNFTKRPESEYEIRTNKRIANECFDNPKIYALVRLIKKIMIKKYSITLDAKFNKYDYEKDDDILMILLTEIDLFEDYFLNDGFYENEAEKFKEFALDFIQSIGIESEKDLLKAYREQKTVMQEYYERIPPDQIDTKTFDQYREIAKYEKYMAEKEDKEKSKPNTRNIPALNLVKPSRTNLVDYDEKKRMVGKKCINASNHSLYDINAYLSGKRAIGYTTDGKKNPDTTLPRANRANAKDVMKRLIFFLATSDKLDDLTPFCYHLDLLTKDIGNQLYVECQNFHSMEGLRYLFGQNPVVKLDLDFAVYVPLSEILDAIYNTKNQVFVLVPTKKVLKYTASMGVQIGLTTVSGHHCQEGTDKLLHTIKVCKGSEENACWPVNEAIELNDVYPNSYFMKQKFYIWSKSENRMDFQWARANQKYIDRVRLANERELRLRRVARGDSQLEDREPVEESPPHPPDDSDEEEPPPDDMEIDQEYLPIIP